MNIRRLIAIVVLTSFIGCEVGSLHSNEDSSHSDVTTTKDSVVGTLKNINNAIYPAYKGIALLIDFLSIFIGSLWAF